MATPSNSPLTAEQRLENQLGDLLRICVLVAAAVVLFGGIIFLARHGQEPSDHSIFRGEPARWTNPVGILEDTLAFRGRGIIQLGVLLLIATPVARVIFSVYAFLRLRDWTYVFVTLFVLATLLYSIFGEFATK